MRVGIQFDVVNAITDNQAGNSDQSLASGANQFDDRKIDNRIRSGLVDDLQSFIQQKRNPPLVFLAPKRSNASASTTATTASSGSSTN
jgi:hypothetical protein